MVVTGQGGGRNENYCSMHINFYNQLMPKEWFCNQILGESKNVWGMSWIIYNDIEKKENMLQVLRLCGSWFLFIERWCITSSGIWYILDKY